MEQAAMSAISAGRDPAGRGGPGRSGRRHRHVRGRLRQLARAVFPRAGAQLRDLGRRREHPAGGGRAGANLVAAAAGPPARRSRRRAVVGPGTGRRARAAALRLAAQQRPRRDRARAGRPRRRPDRRAALVLGRARHPDGAAVQRAEHRAERAARAGGKRRRIHHRRGADPRYRHQQHRAVVPAARWLSCWRAWRLPSSPSPRARRPSPSRC